MTLNIGDLVEHRELHKRGQIIDASVWWGWYKVQWEDLSESLYSRGVHAALERIRKVEKP